MTGEKPAVRSVRATLPPGWYHLVRLWEAASAAQDGPQAPASGWLDAYRVRRCACGTAAPAGGRCRGCGAVMA